MIVVNFKRYRQASAENAVTLTRICAKLAAEYGLDIIPVPQEQDLQSSGIITPVWTQKFESQESIQKGTLLNHSDFRIEKREQLQEEVYLSRSRGDRVCICAETLEEVVVFTQLKPDYLGYEPPELIGSQTTSVAQAKPDIIRKAVVECQKTGVPLLVGAGIKSAADVTTSLRLGAKGILVASAIVLAKNQEQKLRELAQAFSMRS